MKSLPWVVTLTAGLVLANLCAACRAEYTVSPSGEIVSQESTRTPKPALFTSSPQDSATPPLTFLPFVGRAPCQTDTALLTIAAPPDPLLPGDTVTVTLTLKNNGCAMLGLPLYRLNIQSGGNANALEPLDPEPLMHSLAVQPGQSDSAQFSLQGANPGQAALSASASYEVHLGYPGPAYWGYASSAELTLTVSPP